jgi:CBS domain-containing protein
MRVLDVMTTDVAAARPDMTLKDAAAVLLERGVSGMPVLDDGGEVVGVISEGDILAKALPEPERGGSALARLLRRADPDDQRRLEARVVGDAMTAPAITIEAHWPVAEAAEQMHERKVNRLPVVEQGRLVGLVSRADLVRAFARSDDEITAELRDLVALQQEMWRDERPVGIAVTHGEVVLSGEVKHSDEAEILGKMVRTVPGVVGVRSELTWVEGA